MRTPIFVALAATIAGTLLLAGCDTAGTQTGLAEEGDFAQGAFPPTMSDTEYHQQDWIRGDCLSCHKTGEKDAPVIQHLSLTPEAKLVKCRTCHVLVPGSPPR